MEKRKRTFLSLVKSEDVIELIKFLTTYPQFDMNFNSSIALRIAIENNLIYSIRILLFFGAIPIVPLIVVGENKVEILKDLLESGADITSDYLPLLETALNLGYKEISMILLSYSQNYLSSTSNNLILPAIRMGDIEILKLLFEGGLTIDPNSNEPLKVAFEARNSVELVSFLLDHGANPSLSTLSSAIETNSKELVRKLINEFKLPVTRTDIQTAIEVGDLEILSLLLRTDFLSATEYYIRNVDNGNYIEKKALPSAARFGNVEAVELILKEKKGGDYFTLEEALNEAINYGHLEVVKAINSIVSISDDEFINAIENRQYEIIDYILKEEITDYLTRGDLHRTIISAFYIQDVELIKYLFQLLNGKPLSESRAYREDPSSWYYDLERGLFFLKSEDIPTMIEFLSSLPFSFDSRDTIINYLQNGKEDLDTIDYLFNHVSYDEIKLGKDMIFFYGAKRNFVSVFQQMEERNIQMENELDIMETAIEYDSLKVVRYLLSISLYSKEEIEDFFLLAVEKENLRTLKFLLTYEEIDETLIQRAIDIAANKDNLFLVKYLSLYKKEMLKENPIYPVRINNFILSLEENYDHVRREIVKETEVYFDWLSLILFLSDEYLQYTKEDKEDKETNVERFLKILSSLPLEMQIKTILSTSGQNYFQFSPKRFNEVLPEIAQRYLRK